MAQITELGNAAQTLFASVARTFVPMIVGAVVTFLTGLGVELDGELATALAGVLFVLFSIVYYIVVRLLEIYVTPKFSWLLGSSTKPTTYADGK